MQTENLALSKSCINVSSYHPSSKHYAGESSGSTYIFNNPFLYLCTSFQLMSWILFIHLSLGKCLYCRKTYKSQAIVSLLNFRKRHNAFNLLLPNADSVGRRLMVVREVN